MCCAFTNFLLFKNKFFLRINYHQEIVLDFSFIKKFETLQFNLNVISNGSRRFWLFFSFFLFFMFTLTNQMELAPLINYSSKNNPFRSIKIAVTYKLTCFVYTLRDWFIWRLICPCTLLFVRIEREKKNSIKGEK